MSGGPHDPGTPAGRAGQIHIVDTNICGPGMLQAQLLIVEQLAGILQRSPLSCDPA